MRNFGDKIDNTAPLPSGILTAAEDNARFKELENAVSTAGITLDGPTGPDTDFYHLAQAMARYASGGVAAQDGGAANAYVLTSVGSFQMPKAYFQGMMVWFHPTYANTGESMVNAFGLGSKKIYDAEGQLLEGGELIAGRMTVLIYSTSLDSGAGGFKLAPWTGIYITKAITKTVHGTGADFADLFEAMDWLSRRIITRTGSVTFSLAAGVLSYSSPIILNHPNLDRVTFAGAALVASAIQNSTFTVSGVAQTLDKSAQLTALRAIYGTEIRFSTASGYFDSLGIQPTFTRLLITNDGSAPALGGLVMLSNGGAVSDVSVHGSGDHGIIVRSGMFLVSGKLSASGCAGPNIAISDGAGLIQIGNIHSVSSSSYGVAALGGSARWLSGTIQVSGNATGLYATNGGAIVFAAASSSLLYNTNAMVVEHGDIHLYGTGATISNSTYGAFATQGRITARSTAFTTMATYAALAQAGSSVDLTSSTGAGTTSPANNTDGNGNSRVIV